MRCENCRKELWNETVKKVLEYRELYIDVFTKVWFCSEECLAEYNTSKVLRELPVK